MLICTFLLLSMFICVIVYVYFNCCVCLFVLLCMFIFVIVYVYFT